MAVGVAEYRGVRLARPARGTMHRMASGIRIGIIGGTGLEETLLGGVDPQGAKSIVCDTPFGRPSDPIITGCCGDVSIALLSRHGDGHLGWRTYA